MKRHLTWALALSILTMNTYTAFAIDEPTTKANTEEALNIDLNNTLEEETDSNIDLNNTLKEETDSNIDLNNTPQEEAPTETQTQEQPPSLEDSFNNNPWGEDESEEESTTQPPAPETEVPSDEMGKIILKLGNKTAYIDGQERLLDVAPTSKEGQTYVELRFIAEELVKAPIEWLPETQQISLTQGDTQIILSPGSNIASINDMPADMPGPVLVESGRTLVPLRFLSEQFGVVVDYNAEERSITLTVKEYVPPAPNVPPVAAFEFDKTIYTAGQTVGVIENSYDPDGNKIVEKQWMVNQDPTKVNSVLGNIFKKPKEGIYELSLRVKDSRGDWSEWMTQTIEVLPNEKPQITEFSSSKDTYAQGETIKLDYEYVNESWESITAVKWSYRAAHEPENRKIAKAPEAIFSPGNYIVTLQLQDEYGNLSDIMEKTITISSEVFMTEMEYKFNQNNPGTVLDNFDRVNYRDFKEETNVQITKNNNTFIMSDSPERVTDVGILYEEIMQGEGRLMFHHVNAFTPEENAAKKKHVVVTVENTNTEPVTLTIENETVKGPTTDQLYVGQQLLMDYLKGKPAKTYTIQPGETIYIYNSKNIRWASEEVISGMMDFSTTAPLKMRVAAIHTDTNISEIATMSYLAKDMHPRGTFYTTDISYQVQPEAGEPSRLIIGDRNVDVEIGLDAITGEAVVNTGNFGISYLVTVAPQEDTAIILNPRGGIFRGAIQWDGKDTYRLPDVGFLPGSERAALIGVVKAGETKTFEYILPNGSNAPVLLGFIPKSAWDKY